MVLIVFFVANPQKVYGAMSSKLTKLWPHFLDVILKVNWVFVQSTNTKNEIDGKQ